MTTPELTEQEAQRAEIVGLAREFVANEITPNSAAWDSAKEFPAEVHKKLGELGFFGLRIPEEYDGLGLDTLTYVMILEEIAAGDAGISVSVSIHNSLPAHALLKHGSQQQKESWLKPMARGEKLAAFSLSEADAGSDVAGLKTQAVKDGDGWVINGEKAWVTNGDTADFFLMMVRTDTSEDRRGARGISAFLVPRDVDGLVPGRREDKMGLRSSSTTTLSLHDVRLGGESLLGEEGMGFIYAMEALDQGRMGIAAQAVGISRAALDHSVRYASERKQFEVPIGQFQAIQFKLADMATRVAAARALLHEIARAKDAGADVRSESSMAKLFASETAMAVTTEAVQIFGGYGYMRDYPVEKLMRDAKVTEIYEGTSEIQRIVIAKNLTA